MSDPILITGFEPFAGLQSNPSERIARELAAAAGIVTAVLPVSYRLAPPRLAELLARRWRAVLLLGVAPDRTRISLERVAVNHRDLERADNDGALPAGAAVVPDGPAAYASTLPLETMLALLRSRGHDAEISQSAGAYLCNAVFYLARHWLGDAIPCGFVHVPLETRIALPAQVDAVRILVETIPLERSTP